MVIGRHKNLNGDACNFLIPLEFCHGRQAATCPSIWKQSKRKEQRTELRTDRGRHQASNSVCAVSKGSRRQIPQEAVGSRSRAGRLERKELERDAQPAAQGQAWGMDVG